MMTPPMHVRAFGGRSLPAPPFDAENLTYAFGFPVPPPFVTLLNALCEGCASAAAAYERFEDAFGSHLTDHEIRNGYDLSRVWVRTWPVCDMPRCPLHVGYQG